MLYFLPLPPSQRLYPVAHLCPPTQARTGLCANLQIKWIKNSSYIREALKFLKWWWCILIMKFDFWDSLNHWKFLYSNRIGHTHFHPCDCHFHDHGENWKMVWSSVFPILVAFLLNSPDIQCLYPALWPPEWEVGRTNTCKIPSTALDTLLYQLI